MVGRYIPMRNQGREGRLWPQVCGGGRGGVKKSLAGAMETGPGGLFQSGGHREEKGGDEGGGIGGSRGQSHRAKQPIEGEQ